MYNWYGGLATDFVHIGDLSHFEYINVAFGEDYNAVIVTELSHQYCADIDDGIRTKYLVTTMIISHFNHLLWEVNRGNCRLQRAVYPCSFISNTQL